MLLTVIFDCLQNIGEHKTKQRLSRYGVRLLKRCQIIVPQLDTLPVETRGGEKRAKCSRLWRCCTLPLTQTATAFMTPKLRAAARAGPSSPSSPPPGRMANMTTSVLRHGVPVERPWCRSTGPFTPHEAWKVWVSGLNKQDRIRRGTRVFLFCGGGEWTLPAEGTTSESYYLKQLNTRRISTEITNICVKLWKRLTQRSPQRSPVVSLYKIRSPSSLVLNWKLGSSAANVCNKTLNTLGRWRASSSGTSTYEFLLTVSLWVIMYG